MKCVECGFENPPTHHYCGNCGRRLQTTESVRIPGWLRPTPAYEDDGAEIGGSTEDVMEYPVKRLELPRWLWWAKTEIIVRPYSERCFIESRSKLLGATVKRVNSRTHWVIGGIFFITLFIAIAILSIWLSIYSGIWLVGAAFGIPVCLGLLPNIVIFFWSFIPPAE